MNVLQKRTLNRDVCHVLWPTLICLACSAVQAQNDDGLIVASTAEAEVLFIPDREPLIDGELLGEHCVCGGWMTPRSLRLATCRLNLCTTFPRQDNPHHAFPITWFPVTAFSILTSW